MAMVGFKDVMIILISTVLLVSICRYLKISSIIGYLVTGFLLGPHGFDLIASKETIDALSEIGVVFLLFSIGMKLSLKRLYNMKMLVIGLGGTQMVLSILIFSFLGILLEENTISISILLATGLALSSTAIVVQTLTEKGDLSTRYGRVSFAILLAQDFGMVVLLIIMNIIQQSQKTDTLGMLIVYSMSYTIGVFILIILIGRYVFRPMYAFVASLKNQDIFSATSLLVVLGTGMIAQLAGIPMEIGAFIAGVMIAETEYRSQCEADISPFYGLLLGLFFLSIGMKISTDIFMNNRLLISALLMGLLSIKGLIIFISGIIFRIPMSSNIRTSFLLAGGGEFAFIIIEYLHLKQNLISDYISNILIIVVVLSMAATPMLLYFANVIENTILKPKPIKFIKTAKDEIGDLNNHVIIAGFNQIGMLLAEILKTNMIPYVAIDNDMTNVSTGRKNSYQVYYGDPSRIHVLHAIGGDKAKAIVVCLEDEKFAYIVANVSKSTFPKSTVIVSLQKGDLSEKLLKLGIKVAKPKYIEPGLELASITLKETGLSEAEAINAVNNLRSTLYENLEAQKS